MHPPFRSSNPGRAPGLGAGPRVALLLLGLGLCAGAQAADGIVGLAHIGETIVPTRTQYQGTEVGGLSGIDYDAATDTYYAISDDPVATGPVRFYRLKIDLSEGALDANDVTFTGVTEILDPAGASFAPPIDPESLRYDAASDSFYWTNEGSDLEGSLQDPWVRQMRPDGTYVRELVNDDRGLDKYAPTGASGTTGIRHNKSFESLTFSTDRTRLFTATEEALKQDGPTAGVSNPTPARILEFDVATGKPIAEYVLEADPVVEPSNPAGQFVTAGVVELLAYSNTQLLALERSFSVGGFGNGHTAKLYVIDLSDATNVVGIESLEGFDYRPVRKRLLLDLMDLGITLDNLEGMTFGPGLPDGRRSLILVSDNNFNADTQFTQFLAFAVEEGQVPVRFATFNGSFDRFAAGGLVASLSDPDDPKYQQQKNVAEIIQTVRPDVLWFTEFDWDADRAAPGLFQKDFLGVSQNRKAPIVYPYVYQGPFYTDAQGAPESPSNTGIQSGIDLNQDGQINGNDAFGFGNFPGQYASALFSMYPIDMAQIRTFRNFLWKDMPGNLIVADLPAEEQQGTIFNDEAIEILRLSSKNHMDIPIRIGGTLVHLLGAHPTPPVFDSPVLDENGRRNHDEIRLWADYIADQADYLYDDEGVTGGLPAGTLFVIAGDYNADPNDGDSYDFAVRQLLESPMVAAEPIPASTGGPAAAADQGFANDGHLSDPAYDTADFNDATAELCAIVGAGCFTSPGNLRADYTLPSRDLINNVKDISSDHRLVYVDLVLPTSAADLVAVQELNLAYYGRTGDPAGVAYWSERLAASGGDLTAIASAFATSAEAEERFGDSSDADLIEAVYQQLFGRAADEAGKTFYLEQLARGRLTRETLPLDILLGATGTDETAVANKLAVSDYFFEQLAGNDIAFTDQVLAENLAILDGVGLDPLSVPRGKERVDVFVIDFDGIPSYFERIATFPVYFNLAPEEDPATETSSEIIDATEDGETLIYTDSPRGGVGFVDIREPRAPLPLGFLELEGEPTSVAVAGHYALVGVNTSESFVAPSGNLTVIDLTDVTAPVVVAEIDLGGQPDSVAVSPDGTLAAIAIENERDEDACAAGDGSLIDEAYEDEDLCEELGGLLGGIPQLPAGFLVLVDLVGDPGSWITRVVDVTGLAAVAPEDPEPEFVDINDWNEVAITLQENNHIAVVDGITGGIVADFPSGAVDLTAIDAVENSLIDLMYDRFDLAREPDAIGWVFGDTLMTANEGDYLGGSRGATLFDMAGGVLLDTMESLEYAAVALAHFPESRADAKGIEPEGIEVGGFGPDNLVFVGSERGNFAAVLSGNTPEELAVNQVLPTGVGPEGLRAIPARGLFVVAAETDDAGAGFRSTISIYRRANVPPFYPEIQSLGEPPIGWGALSALAADIRNPHLLYTVHDSYFRQSRIYRVDVGQTPATIVSQLVLTKDGDFVDYDLEGLVQRAGGGFWAVSEGRADGAPNLLIEIDADGMVMAEIELPPEVSENRTNSGFEGVAVTGSGADETVLVAIQREWDDDEPGFVKIGRYLPDTGVWDFFYYPLSVPPVLGAWVGLSEIVSLGDGDSFAVIERDNQQGPLATIKRIYGFALSQATDEGLAYPVLAKELLRDLLPDLLATNGWVPDKVEGLTIALDDEVYVVTDNDGIDDAVGETFFLRLGTTEEAFDGN